jgi:hypothetical protein
MLRLSRIRVCERDGMARNILILGASYGSLLGTKLLMAGHNVTLPFIERVDLLVKLISHQLGVPNAEIDRTVETVDQKLNEKIVQGGSGAT